MTDLIERQDAIDAVMFEPRYSDKIARIKNLPAAEPERKTGKWLETEFLKLRECSCCGARWGVYSIEEFQYCPTCGAKMEAGHE